MKKMMPVSEVKELLRDIREFCAGVDSEITAYITEMIKTL